MSSAALHDGRPAGMTSPQDVGVRPSADAAAPPAPNPAPNQPPNAPGSDRTWGPSRAIAGLLKGLSGFLWRPALLSKPKSRTPFLDNGGGFDDLATPYSETGNESEWDVCGMYGKAPSPEDQRTLLWAYQEGSRLMELQQFGEAAAAYTEGLKVARSRSDKARLAYNRSAAFARLSKLCRSHPERRSTCAGPLKNMDSKSLAEMAKNDAKDATFSRYKWAKAHMRLGAAEFLLGYTWAAERDFLEGLRLDALYTPLQIGLREVRGEAGPVDNDEDVGTAAAAAAAAAAAGAATNQAAASTPAAAAPAATDASAAASAAAARRQRSMLAASAGLGALGAWDCCLCSKLLYEPVTTPCGHTFCRECFLRATDDDSDPRCPTCRTELVLVDRDELRPSHTLVAIISRAFPGEYEERRREAAAGQRRGLLGLGGPRRRMGAGARARTGTGAGGVAGGGARSQGGPGARVGAGAGAGVREGPAAGLGAGWGNMQEEEIAAAAEDAAAAFEAAFAVGTKFMDAFAEAWDRRQRGQRAGGLAGGVRRC